jgi:hypothetical protein
MTPPVKLHMSMRNADARIHMRTDRQKRVSRESMPADGVQAAAYGGTSARPAGSTSKPYISSRGSKRGEKDRYWRGPKKGDGFQWVQVANYHAF